MHRNKQGSSKWGQPHAKATPPGMFGQPRRRGVLRASPDPTKASASPTATPGGPGWQRDHPAWGQPSTGSKVEGVSRSGGTPPEVRRRRPEVAGHAGPASAPGRSGLPGPYSASPVNGPYSAGGGGDATMHGGLGAADQFPRMQMQFGKDVATGSEPLPNQEHSPRVPKRVWELTDGHHHPAAEGVSPQVAQSCGWCTTVVRPGPVSHTRLVATAVLSRYDPSLRQLETAGVTMTTKGQTTVAILPGVPFSSELLDSVGITSEFVGAGFGDDALTVRLSITAGRDVQCVVYGGIPAGQLFVPAQISRVQSLVLKEDLPFRLVPGRVFEARVAAYCGNVTFGCPQETPLRCVPYIVNFGALQSQLDVWATLRPGPHLVNHGRSRQPMPYMPTAAECAAGMDMLWQAQGMIEEAKDRAAGTLPPHFEGLADTVSSQLVVQRGDMLETRVAALEAMMHNLIYAAAALLVIVLGCQIF
mmetsp:Transcript_4859/g.12488  ORF Transcript_4859/g.12488 Transcript_4859/m.12488 type:complete len:474 (-) Transcript_4859:113-1534(-)